MAIQTFQFVVFEPSPLQIVADNPIAMDVNLPSPEEVDRPYLRTRAFAREVVVHDAFHGFTFLHDAVGHYSAYDDVPDPEDDDEPQVFTYIGASRFHAYELGNNPGYLYAGTSLSNLKEVFRRYRANVGSAVIRQRIVNVWDLEKALRQNFGANISEYVLLNVNSDTAVSRVDIRGQDISDNDEMQNMKNRAEYLQTLGFGFLHEGVVLGISISMNGAVKFARYPGDHPALEVLCQLEPYIATSSELATIKVR